MVESFVLRVVRTSIRHTLLTLIVALLVCVAAASYAVSHFAINTDSSKLISPDVIWRQNEAAFNAAFPNLAGELIVVVDAQTPGQADAAATALATRLTAMPNAIRSVRQAGSDEFFKRNGLLYKSPDEVQRVTSNLVRSRPLLQPLAAEPNLEGLAHMLSGLSVAVSKGQVQSAALDPAPLASITTTINSVLSGHPSPLDWTSLVAGGDKRGTRRILLVRPVLDFGSLQPGHLASGAIRGTAKDLHFTPEAGIRIRLTGDVPMADDEFGTLAEGAALNGTLTILAVLAILWLALRSGRIILAVVISLVVGLAITAALGLLMFGSFNLISIAFAVLFVGLGVDFGIQFSVRYREERYLSGDLVTALEQTASKVARPLALAAVAVAAGFCSFLPTSYRGLSELGLIAGTGMIIAFFTSITVLPALLRVLRSPGEPASVGFRFLVPVDRFTARHRFPILFGTLAVVAAGLPLLWHVHVDFNPIHLRSASVESVATFIDLAQDPDTSAATIHILRPNLQSAQETARKLDSLPEVDRTVTLASFIPDNQEEKLAAIEQARAALEPIFAAHTSSATRPDGEIVTSLRQAAHALGTLSNKTFADLGEALNRLSDAPPEARTRAQQALFSTFPAMLSLLRENLNAGLITGENLPTDLKRDWTAADGRSAVQVFARGNSNDNAVLRRFAAAVRAVAPDATGYPVTIQEASETVISAFLRAGAFALVSITILLFIVLKRVTDVLLTLIPLLLAGIVTLELTVLLHIPLNFANIIALPLLLGVGVAFKVYYVMAWRAGESNLLASSLTRAVLFSAATTAAAFGSLWFSHHPGTSSMGKLLALSLVCTLAAAVFFQPILMGPPRESDDPK